MSIRIMTQVWERPLRSTAHKLVLLALADHADDDGNCWPSLHRIAAKSGLTVRTVQRHLRDLEGDGHLSITALKGRTNRYLIHPTPVTSDTPDTNDTPDTSDTGTPDTSDTPPLTPVTPEPSMNHQPEPPVRPSGPAADDDDFETWWRTYPAKVGKRAARTAYRQALTRCAGPWVLHQGLAAALPDLTGREPRYIPNPATWLNQDRWLDQPPPAQPGNITRQHHAVMRLLGQATP